MAGVTCELNKSLWPSLGTLSRALLRKRRNDSRAFLYRIFFNGRHFLLSSLEITAAVDGTAAVVVAGSVATEVVVAASSVANTHPVVACLCSLTSEGRARRLEPNTVASLAAACVPLPRRRCPGAGSLV